MKKLMGVIFLLVLAMTLSCAVSMTDPSDVQDLPLVYKINITESDLTNFVMLCEAVDGVDDTTLEERCRSKNRNSIK